MFTSKVENPGSDRKIIQYSLAEQCHGVANRWYPMRRPPDIAHQEGACVDDDTDP
jgi:hypothetical protein